jgi:hypothetical protein
MTGSTSEAAIHPRDAGLPDRLFGDLAVQPPLQKYFGFLPDPNRRVGWGAKRYPSIAFLGDDGFRRAQPILLAERDLLNRINVICPVQRHLQK